MKTRILFSTLFSLLLISKLFGQITFQKSFNLFSNGIPSVEETNDGGYVITGRMLIKTNAMGDTIWTKSYPFGSSNVTCAQQTYDGGYAIAGYIFNIGAGNTDCFLTKTDSLGNIAWSKAYGGFSADEAHSIHQTTDSGFVLAGRSRSFFAFNGWDSYVVKTDLNGNILWTKVIGGAGDSKASTVRQTNDGGFIVGGSYGVLDTSGSYDNRAFVTKLDVNGNAIWSKTYSGPGTEFVSCIRQTTDGGYVLTGTTYNFSWTLPVVVLFSIKTDSAGNIQWSRYYARDFTFGNSIEQTNDGGYIITGQVRQSSGYMDVCLIKTDNTGDTLWTKAFGGADNDGGTSVKQTNDGGYIVTGSSSSFSHGFYLIKTDSMGNSGCNQSPTLITIIDTLIYESAFTYVVDTGGTATSFTVLASNGSSVNPICFAVGINEVTSDDFFHVFPNPSSGSFTVIAKSTVKKGSIQVFNIHGAPVYETTIFDSSTKEIHLRSAAPGIYFVKVLDGEKQCTVGKLIITRE